jgi:transcriptional regulator with XRE-family HTH domain
MTTVKLNYSKLRGRIKEKIGTEGAFAKAIGRSQNYITKVFQGRTYFTQADICKSADVLSVDQDEIGIYFFAPEFTNAEHPEE